MREKDIYGDTSHSIQLQVVKAQEFTLSSHFFDRSHLSLSSDNSTASFHNNPTAEQQITINTPKMLAYRNRGRPNAIPAALQAEIKKADAAFGTQEGGRESS